VRARLGRDLVPLAPDLVFGGPFAAPDAAEFVVDLAAGGCRADEPPSWSPVASLRSPPPRPSITRSPPKKMKQPAKTPAADQSAAGCLLD
jgi:hypothetical protein